MVQNNNNKMPYSCACKVILDSDELPRSSRQWTRAKKYDLKLDENGLYFNNTSTHYGDIEKATIHIYSSALFFEYGVLSITSNGKTNHFGIKYADFWKEELPFGVERIQEETPFLLFRRSLIILILIYIFWEVVKQ